MKFLDLAKVYIRSGSGGGGCISFRKEKFIEFGGKVVAPMVKRITPDAQQKSIVSMDDIEALAGAL